MLILGATVGAVAGTGAWVWVLRRAWHTELRLRRERLMRERAERRESKGDAGVE